MALNERSGLFFIEIATFAGVAGYLIYKWNTTRSVGEIFSDLGNDIEAGASAAESYLADFVNSFENGLANIGASPAPAYQQVTVGLSPQVYQSGQGYQGPPPAVTEAGYGYIPPPPPTPAQTEYTSQNGHNIPGGDVIVTPEVQADIDQVQAQLAAANWHPPQGAPPPPVAPESSTPSAPPQPPPPPPAATVDVNLDDRGGRAGVQPGAPVHRGIN